MIIDIHAHVCAAPELYQWKAGLMASRGAHGFVPKTFSNDYYDTVLHAKKSIEMLVHVVGSGNVLFGTENPGSGSTLNRRPARLLTTSSR